MSDNLFLIFYILFTIAGRLVGYGGMILGAVYMLPSNLFNGK